MSRMNLRAAGAAAVLVVGALLAGCDADPDAHGVRTLRPDWQQVSLPVPPGPSGRLAVRDAATCGGRWFLVGGVIGADGSSRPVAWSSADARTWDLVRLDPATYYAHRAVLSSVACREGGVAAVGSRSGGAHGNPRVTSWYQRPDGALVDMRATFELYGGPEAISVRHVTAGPRGWLIGGNRLGGAAVWVSADATDFRIVDGDPGLASDAETKTSALDQVWDGTGWTVVGRVEKVGRISPVPFSWTSTDGQSWTRRPVPAATDGFADLERVVRDDHGDLLAAGLRGSRFGLWQRAGSRWKAGDSFGAYAGTLTGPPFVSSIATRAGTVLVAVSDGARFRLWADRGRGPWHPVAAPAQPIATGDTQLAVVGDGGTVLLLADDGTSGRVWTTGWNTLSR